MVPNKSVNLANNTLTGTFAQFNTAVSNATLVSTTGTETLTNKSLTAPVLTGSSTSGCPKVKLQWMNTIIQMAHDMA